MAPFSLLSYADAKQHAREIAFVTRRRIMPPWLPDTSVDTFIDQRFLSDHEISTIERWVAQGAPEGNASAAPRPPQFADGWQLGKPDLVLQAPEGYVLPANGGEVYHNFVFRVPISATRYVRAIEIRPGNTMALHHANVLIDRMQWGRRKDRDGLGFDGMDVELASDAFEPDSHFIYWKPGTVPYFEPDDMTWPLTPGTDLILNMHLRPSGMPEPIRPSLGLYFSDKPPTVRPMLLELDRDDALDIPAGVSRFPVADDFKLPLDVDVLAIYPHAHYLGRELHAYATLPDGSRRWLLRIDHWDPGWQGVFRYRKPIHLPQGSVISMRYVYDNSKDNPRNPNRPPQRVMGGNRSTDEMAHLRLQVIAKNAPDGTDGRRVLQEALMRHTLEREPSNYVANYNLASLLLARGDTDGAIQHFERAAQQRPEEPSVLNGLGAALLAGGRVDEAIMRFRAAIQADVGNTDAHYNLASALASTGSFHESAAEFQRVLEQRPNDAEAQARLGTVLAELHDYDGAEAHFRRALDLDPQNETAKKSMEMLQRLRSSSR